MTKGIRYRQFTRQHLLKRKSWTIISLFCVPLERQNFWNGPMFLWKDNAFEMDRKVQGKLQEGKCHLASKHTFVLLICWTFSASRKPEDLDQIWKMQAGNFNRIYKITIKIGLENVGYSPNILELARGTANMLAHRQHFLMAFNGGKNAYTSDLKQTFWVLHSPIDSLCFDPFISEAIRYK